MRYLSVFALSLAACTAGVQIASAGFFDSLNDAAARQVRAIEQVQKSLPASVQPMITKVREDIAKLPDDQ